MSSLSTHVLDTCRGRPAAGVPVLLERAGTDGAFGGVARGVTDADGRVKVLGTALEPGVYRLTFELEDYLARPDGPAFYPRARVEFRMLASEEHYHIPLLLSAFGYSTYRGS